MSEIEGACPHCPHCRQTLGIGAVRLGVWYMHDNHGVTRLRNELGGDIDTLVSAARRIGAESPHGLLAARLLDKHERTVRDVGGSIHARAGGFAESDLLAWREALLADPVAVRLLGEGRC